MSKLDMWAAAGWLSVSVMFVCAPGVVSMAAAQGTASGKKWEIEVHGGGLFAQNVTEGTTIDQFAAGQPIPTGGGSSTSRAVSSWYFGDGAMLINQVNTTFGVAARVTPLDPALKRPMATRNNIASFGARIARDLTRRLTAEFAVDYGANTLELTDEASTAIEAARSTFSTAWSALLATGATTNRQVSSIAEVIRGDASQVSTTGALRVRLNPVGRIHPYITAGAGAVFLRGPLPSATLTGNYGFLFGGVFPMNERDIVTMRVQRKDRALVGIVGGGIDVPFSRFSQRHSIRADARLNLSGNRMNTVVSATPSVTTQSPAFAINTGFVPSIQFSNSSQLNRPSSLSGPAITDLETFKGSGLHNDLLVTVGYVVRF